MSTFGKTNIKTALNFMAVAALISSCAPKQVEMETPPSDSAALASTQNTRYICADDVIVRGDDINQILDLAPKFGARVELVGGQQIADPSGSGKSHDYRKVNFPEMSNAKGWVSTVFFKTAPCAGSGKGNLPSDSVLAFSVEPGLAAMLDVIAYAEFRGHPSYQFGEAAYKTLFNYVPFHSYARHPETVICSGGLCSNAAGRYQIMSDSRPGREAAWELAKLWRDQGRLGAIKYVDGNSFRDFSPANQQRAALVLIWSKFAYEPLRTLKYGDYSTLSQVEKKLAPTWASFPSSPHGQGHISWTAFKDFFWKRYKAYSN